MYTYYIIIHKSTACNTVQHDIFYILYLPSPIFLLLSPFGSCALFSDIAELMIDPIDKHLKPHSVTKNLSPVDRKVAL